MNFEDNSKEMDVKIDFVSIALKHKDNIRCILNCDSFIRIKFVSEPYVEENTIKKCKLLWS